MKKNKPGKLDLDENNNGENMSKSNNKKANEDIALRVNQFISLINDLPYGTVLIHRNGIYFNKTVEKMIGYKNDEIHDIDDWFKVLYKEDAEKIKEIYYENRGKNFESEVIVDIVTKSGEIRKIAFVDKLSPIGEIWGLEDRTELFDVKAEKIKQSEEYNQLLEFVNIGFWEWDIETDNLIWNDNMYSIYGFGEVKTVTSYDDYKDRLHPDDIDQMNRDLEHVLDSSVEDFNNNFRIILPDGRIKHIRAVAKIYRDKNDKAIKLVGLNWDITKEVELKEESKDLAERYDFILSSINMGIWDWDLKSDKLILNDTMKEIVGFDIGNICNSESLLNLLHPDDEDKMKTELYDTINSLDQGFDSTFRVILEEGTLKHMRSVAKIHRDEDGIAIRMVGLNWDITNEVEVEKTKEKLTEQHSLILESIEVGVWDWTFKADDPEWNDAMYKLYEISVNSEGLLDIFQTKLHPDDVERVNTELEHVINTPGEEFESKFRIVLTDGTIRHIKAFSKTYRDEKGKAYRMVGINKDVTNEEKEKEKNEEYHHFLDFMKIGFWEWEMESGAIVWDKVMYEIFGYNYGYEVSYNDYKNVLHPEDAERIEKELTDVINTPGNEFRGTFRIILDDGTLKHVRAVAKAYRNEDGIATKMVGLNWDVTNEIELEERYRFILDAIEMGVWDWDIESEVMTWNENMYSLYGFEKDEKFNNIENFQAILYPDDKKRVNNEVEYAISTPGIEFESTFRIIKNETDIMYIQSVSKAYRDETGRAIRMVGLNRDVTKEKELEEESKKIAEKYDQILSPIGIGIWDWDIVTDKFNWNETMYEVFGYDKNNEVNCYSDFKKLLHPDDTERVDKEIKNTINTPDVEFESDFCVLLDDGTIKHIRSVSKAYRDEDGKAVRMAGVSMDVTKERELEEESKELSEKYELILNNTKVGVWDWDIKSNKISRSRTILELFEAPDNSDENFDTTFGRFTEKVHPEDLKKLESDMEKIRSGKIENFESEIRIITSNGTTKHLKSVVNNEKDDDGNLIRIYGIFLDNSKIKEYEKELIEEKNKAEAASKSKSEFLANMSHEIRTPMNAIMGLTYLTQKTELDNKQKDYLDKIQKSSTSLLGILNDILDFSKVEAGKIELENIEFEIDDVLESVSDIVTDKADEKGLEVIFSIDQDVPRYIISDPLRIKQIILNLCSNAVKFTEHGEIILKIEKVASELNDVELKITISDTGIGINENQIGNLFKTFTQADSSTTRKYGGSGLGLAISKNLVDLLGGKIGVTSEYGKGSNFFFTFMCKVSNQNINNSRTPHVDLVGMKVLVCDDNESLREFFQDILTSFSFEVTTVDNGYDAIKEIQYSNPKPYDLILMDWKMPDLDGIETINEINKLKLSRIPTIIMVTAYAKEEVLQKSDEIKFDAFLSKPVTPSALYDSIVKLFEPKIGTVASNGSKTINNDEKYEIFSGKKVLLVEDNEINQLVAKELLNNEGILVDIANNGDEAIFMSQKKNYDIVLMDLHMPEKDGYDAALGIREKYSSEELPIIAMTADAMSGVKEKCLKVGMNGFITKPVKAERLYHVLSKWLLKKPNYEASIDNNIEDKNLINGIDLKAGFDSVGGNEELYLKLLKKFKHSYQNFFDELLSIPVSDKIQIERKIHTLKGVAGIIGAKTLYNLTEKYMGLLNSGFEPNSENMEDLKLELGKVLKSTSKYIGSMNESSELSNSSESLMEKKNELERLLRDNDYNSIKVIGEILSSTDYSAHEEEFNLINKYITEYEFEKALLELNKIKL